ncbi:hypothetical protein M4V62_42610 [Streptomyces durmitorensis]|uniref:Uncharacterized protein n=1 Tax=Streptomyces durmitorensis TaxID=319947 RepID=A0ABY4Q7K5_9ACTN|nr:hypothetical protein [Streptomyces durmitorensis]UQT61233.1 hypothetical protein M4V62_42610 [Streptomyces durmitorensis]
MPTVQPAGDMVLHELAEQYDSLAVRASLEAGAVDAVVGVRLLPGEVGLGHLPLRGRGLAVPCLCGVLEGEFAFDVDVEAVVVQCGGDAAQEFGAGLEPGIESGARWAPVARFPAQSGNQEP